MRNRRLLILPVIIGAVYVVSCDAMKSMEEMKATTEGMSGTTQDLRDMTANLLYDGRDGLVVPEAIQAYRDAKAANDLQTKVEKAMLYFGLLPYQRWTPAHESVAQRDLLLWRAVQLYFGTIQELIVDNFPISNPFVTNNSNDWNTLGAMTVGMSYIDREQTSRISGTTQPALSVYDLIKSALQNRDDYIRARASAPDWAKEVLNYEAQAWYLLQLRQAFFPVVLLAKLTDNDDLLFGFNHLSTWRFLTGMASATYDVDLSDLNEIEIRQIIDWADKITDTRTFLTDHQKILRKNDVISVLGRQIVLKAQKPADFIENSADPSTLRTLRVALVDRLNKTLGCPANVQQK